MGTRRITPFVCVLALAVAGCGLARDPDPVAKGSPDRSTTTTTIEVPGPLPEPSTPETDGLDPDLPPTSAAVPTTAPPPAGGAPTTAPVVPASSSDLPDLAPSVEQRIRPEDRPYCDTLRVFGIVGPALVQVPPSATLEQHREAIGATTIALARLVGAAPSSIRPLATVVQERWQPLASAAGGPGPVAQLRQLMLATLQNIVVPATNVYDASVSVCPGVLLRAAPSVTFQP